MELTDRERQLIDALASKVRMFSAEQIARSWWPDSESGRNNCRNRLRELTARGLLNRTQIFCPPLLPLREPVYCWQPGKEPPNFGALSWQLQSRWTKEPRPTTVYLASPRAVKLFGGTADGKIKNIFQATHDVHLAGVFLRLLETAPRLAASWVGEDVLAPTRVRQKLPDAILHDDQGRPRLVIEFGGSYPPERVADFHQDNLARGLPYEMW
jgi:hypothetical protein